MTKQTVYTPHRNARKGLDEIRHYVLGAHPKSHPKRKAHRDEALKTRECLQGSYGFFFNEGKGREIGNFINLYTSLLRQLDAS